MRHATLQTAVLHPVSSLSPQARMFSTPSVVDMDADGRPEIIAATGTGRVYVLDAAGEGGGVVMYEVRQVREGRVYVLDAAGEGGAWECEGVCER